ncbi:VOC family protein [Deinococcus sp.]|uniref:VOC family protein n=1 Tax=Deinococcus sp. TaxID=47478 RepID=UPI0025F72FB0|nr:VOC family protein [Deinococcus sp.]
MRPSVLLCTADVARAEAFYVGLGFKLRRHSRSGGWTELEWSDLLLFLHHAQTLPPANGRLQLGFEAQEPLEILSARLIERGVAVSAEIVDEGFGRTLSLRDPDDNELVIVEHEPELYA